MSIHVSALVWKLDCPGMAKLVLLKLADHAKDDGSDVHPSQKSVARECGVTDRTVRSVICDAIDAGWLVEEPTPGNRPNRYRFNIVALADGSKFQAERDSRWNKVPASRKDVPASRNHVPAINKKHQLTINESSGGRPRFVPPSLEDCVAYAGEISLSPSDAEAFHDFWTSAGWKRKQGMMADWKASLRTWKRNLAKFGPSAGKGGSAPKPHASEVRLA